MPAVRCERPRALLVTAYERAEAGSGHLDQAELTQCVKALTEMVKSLTDTGAEHQAAPAKHEPRTALAEAVERLGAGANDRKNDTGAKPIVALNAPEGVVVATPKTVLVAANQTIELAAQASQTLTAAEQVVVTAGKGISQFAYTGGVKIIAHQDTLDLQAQHGEAHVQALKAVRLSAVEGHITLNAKERLTLLCGGAYITLSEGNIEIGCPGELTVKAKTKYVGSASASEAMNGWEKAQFDERFVVRDEITDEPLRNALMELIRGDGTKLRLTTDSEGRLPKQRSEASERITLRPIRTTPQHKG